MSKRFTDSGRLHIPLKADVVLPRDRVDREKGGLVVRQAYCPNGHSLMSDVEIDGEKGIHFVYESTESGAQAGIVISPFVGKCKKRILSGKAFAKDEVVRILCPTCRAELPVLFACECGARFCLFYIDSRLRHNYGQSVCSRIGCVRASQLRFSEDALHSFLNQHGF